MFYKTGGLKINYTYYYKEIVIYMCNMLNFYSNSTVSELKKNCIKHKVKGYSLCKNKKDLIVFLHNKIKQQHINKLMMINKLSKIQCKKFNPVATVFKQKLFITKINNFLDPEKEIRECKYDNSYIRQQKYKERDPVEFPLFFIENNNYDKKFYLELRDFSKKIHSIAFLKKKYKCNSAKMKIYIDYLIIMKRVVYYRVYNVNKPVFGENKYSMEYKLNSLYYAINKEQYIVNVKMKNLINNWTEFCDSCNKKIPHLENTENIIIDKNNIKKSIFSHFGVIYSDDFTENGNGVLTKTQIKRIIFTCDNFNIDKIIRISIDIYKFYYHAEFESYYSFHHYINKTKTTGEYRLKIII